MPATPSDDASTTAHCPGWGGEIAVPHTSSRAGRAPAPPSPPRGALRALPILAVLAAVACLWEGVKLAFAIPDQRLPHLGAIAADMFTRTQGGAGDLLLVQMLRNAWATFRVACGGFLIGALLGLGLAVLFLRAPLLERGLLPYVIGSQTVPILAIAPMVVVGLGRLDAPAWAAKVVVAAYLSFFPVTIGAMRGLRSASPQSLDLMRSYAASPLQTLWKLRLPAALPLIFTSLKVAASASVVGAIVAELPAGAREGIGVMILTAAQFYNSRPTALYLAILVAGLLGVACYSLVAFAERLALRARPAGQA